MTTRIAERLLESLDRHFLAGCPALSLGQLEAHEREDSRAECMARATRLAGLGAGKAAAA